MTFTALINCIAEFVSECHLLKSDTDITNDSFNIFLSTSDHWRGRRLARTGFHGVKAARFTEYIKATEHQHTYRDYPKIIFFTYLNLHLCVHE